MGNFFTLLSNKIVLIVLLLNASIFSVLATECPVPEPDCFDPCASIITWDPNPSANCESTFNETFTWCYTPDNYTQISVDWLHTICFNFGEGWGNVVNTSITGNNGASCGSAGSWDWYDMSLACTDNLGANGITILEDNPCAFDDPGGGCCDCDNSIPNPWEGCVIFSNTGVAAWGDAGGGDACPEVCFELTTLTLGQYSTDPATDLSIEVTTSSDSESGSWLTPGAGCDCDAVCNFVDSTCVLVPCETPNAPLVSGPNTVCDQEVIEYCITNPDPLSIFYNWFDGNGTLIGNTDVANPCLIIDWGLFANTTGFYIEYNSQDCFDAPVPNFTYNFPIDFIASPIIGLATSDPLATCPGVPITFSAEDLTPAGLTQVLEFCNDPSLMETIPNGTGVPLEICVDVQGIFDDNGMPGVYDANMGEIAYLNIASLDFCYLQDLQIELVSPTAGSIDLMNGLGSTFSDLVNTCFLEIGSGADPISGTTGIANFNDCYLPQELFLLLGGTDLNGQWCLNFTDFTNNVNCPTTTPDFNQVGEWCIGITTSLTTDETTITWTNSNGTQDGIVSTNGWEITVDEPGTYTVSVQNDVGCTGYLDVVVGEGTPVLLTAPDTMCTNSDIIQIMAQLANGSTPSPPGTWSISTPGFINPVTGVIDLSQTPAGNYDVTYDMGNNGNCDQITILPIIINQAPNVGFLSLFEDYCVGNLGPIIDVICTPTGTALVDGVQQSQIFGGDQTLWGTSPELTCFFTDANGCYDDTTQVINLIEQEDASFDYDSPYCQDQGNVSPTLTGTPGGTFSSGSGLSINSATGEIDLAASTCGGYSVSYTTNDPNCGATENVFVVVACVPISTFSYPITNMCINETDTIWPDLPSGTLTGGQWSYTALSGGPDLYIENDITIPNNGYILAYLSDAGVYEVTYTNTNPTCGTTAETFEITIGDEENGDFTINPTDYCPSDLTVTPVLDPLAVTGGTWSITTTNGVAGSLNIDPATGVVDISTAAPGDYDVSYLTSATSCGTANPQTITIQAEEDASFDFNTLICTNDISATPDAVVTLNGQWEIDPIPPIDIDPFTGEIQVDGNLTLGQTYTVTYTTDGLNGCVGQATDQFTIVVPDLQITVPTDLCSNDDNPYFPDGNQPAGTFDVCLGVNCDFNVTSFIPSNYDAGDILDVTLNYYDPTLDCDHSVTEQFVINGIPNLTTNLDVAYCETSAPVDPLIGTPGPGFFIDMATGLVITAFDPAVYAAAGNAEICYQYTDPTTLCNDEICYQISIDPQPSIDNLLDESYCIDDGVINLVGSPSINVTWTVTANGMTTNNATSFNTATDGPLVTVLMEYDDGLGCVANLQEGIVINDLPAVNITNNTAYCEDAGIVPLTADQAPASFTFDGMNTADFDASDYSGPIVAQVFYDEIDQFGTTCSNSNTMNITINPLPNLQWEATSANSYCLTSSPVSCDDLVNLPNCTCTVNGNPINDLIPADYPPGNITVEATNTDVNGCTSTISQIVEIVDLPTLSTNIASPYCTNSNDLEILGNQTAAFSTYSISPTGTLGGGNTMDFSALGAGNFDVTYDYDDGNGCVNSLVVPVVVNAEPTGSLTSIDAACSDAGVIQLTCSFGPGCVFYNDANGLNFPSNQLNPANYPNGDVISVAFDYTDANSCSTTITTDVTITPTPNPSFTNLLNQYCEDASAFLLSADITGGTFEIDNVEETTFSPGQYAATSPAIVTYFVDINGCSNTITQSVDIDLLDDASFDFDDSYCQNFGIALPNFVTSPTATFTGFPLVTNSSTGEIDLTNGVVGQSYDIQIITNDGCPNIATETITITDSDDATIEYASNSYCYLDPNPLPIDIVTPGGTFSISSNNPALNINNTTGEINLASATENDNITITYSTSGACASSETFIISLNNGLDAGFVLSDYVYCPGESIAIPSALGSFGGVFSADNGLLIDAITGQIDESTAADGQSYTITYTTAQGECENFSSRLIEILEIPEFEVTSNEGVCVGEWAQVEFATTSQIAIDENDLVWNFDGANVVSGSGDGPYVLDFNEQGLYNIVVSVGNSSCPVVPAETSILVQDLDVATIEDISITNGEQISLNTQANSPNVIYNWYAVLAGDTTVVSEFTLALLDSTVFDYSLENAIGLSCFNCQSPLAQPSDDVMYVVEAEDEVTGCKRTAQVFVDVTIEPPYVANIFTPNGDGLNDEISVLKATGVKEMVFNVFNRWGELVFSTNSPEEAWDGKYGGKILTSDVFVYTLNYVLLDDSEGFDKGNITLVK